MEFSQSVTFSRGASWLPCDVSVRRMSRGRGGRVVEACHQLDRGRDQGSRCCLNIHQRNHLIGALSSEKPSQGNGWFPVIAGSSPEGSGGRRWDGGPAIDPGRRCRQPGPFNPVGGFREPQKTFTAVMRDSARDRFQMVLAAIKHDGHGLPLIRWMTVGLSIEVIHQLKNSHVLVKMPAGY